MAKIELKNSITLSDFSKPFMVAEVNTSHFGDIKIAKKMIDKAKTIGVDCVKFQSWSSESLYSNDYYKKNPISKRIVEKFSFSEFELLKLSEYCGVIDIGFASTPYSVEEVDFLIDKCNVPYIKVASMDLNNYRYLSYIAGRGVPIVLSTGMSEMHEIKKAIKTIENAGNDKICILHCVSTYPNEISTIRLNNILGLRSEFPDYPVGFSDHSIGNEIPTAAVALGACMIEKHFTLDKTKIGMDNQMASEPNEMAQMIKQCNNVQAAMGGIERKVSSSEMDQRIKMRRSIVAKKDLRAGAILKIELLDVKRPGTGMPPEKIDVVLGKTLKNNLSKDSILDKKDLA